MNEDCKKFLCELAGHPPPYVIPDGEWDSFTFSLKDLTKAMWAINDDKTKWFILMNCFNQYIVYKGEDLKHGSTLNKDKLFTNKQESLEAALEYVYKEIKDK